MAERSECHSEVRRKWFRTMIRKWAHWKVAWCFAQSWRTHVLLDSDPKGDCNFPTTVQRVTNLEKQTDEFKSAIDEFDAAIRVRFKEDEEPGYEGSKPNPEDWSEFLEFDPDFQEEFNEIVNDTNIPEADKDFTPDVFDDTYLNMELAIPRDGDGPEYARVTKRLKDKDG